jgi:hypothetical protein
MANTMTKSITHAFKPHQANTADSPATPSDGYVCLGYGRPRFPFDLPRKRRCPDQVAAEVRRLIHELAEGRRPWPLFLFGEAGSGKSCAGLCMVDVFGGMYVELPTLCDMITDAQFGRLLWSSGHPRTTRDIWSAWHGLVETKEDGNTIQRVTTPLGVLDEVGTRTNISDHHYATLKKAIDLREGRPTVYISNLDLDGISKAYDDRIASRLAAGTVYRTRGDRRVGLVPTLVTMGE